MICETSHRIFDKGSRHFNTAILMLHYIDDSNANIHAQQNISMKL